MRSPLVRTWAFQCQRLECGHIWLPKGSSSAKGAEPPKTCPACKSYVWQRSINAKPGRKSGKGY